MKVEEKIQKMLKHTVWAQIWLFVGLNLMYGSRMDRGWIGDGPSLAYPSLARILELQDFEFCIPELYAPPVLTPKSTRTTYNYKTDWLIYIYIYMYIYIYSGP